MIAGHSHPYWKIPVSVWLQGPDHMVLNDFYGFYVPWQNCLLCSYSSQPVNHCETTMQCAYCNYGVKRSG